MWADDKQREVVSDMWPGIPRRKSFFALPSTVVCQPELAFRQDSPDRYGKIVARGTGSG
jgi:hypothetical protein